MVLAGVLLNVAAVVSLLILVSAPLVVGRSRFRDLFEQFRPRIRRALPYLAVLGATLVVNSYARQFGPEFSWIFGWNITGLIFDIEGPLVAVIQAAVPAPVVTYFGFMYVYGYVYLLVFPVLAYLALADPRPLRRTVLAYTFNYAIGLACYMVFIAYGPRNLMPDLVDPLLYTNWPRSQLLTSQVNANTNVFPSLHSSLSATVAILAYRTRAEFPLWFTLATVFGVSVTLSTMVLGIHWGIDVVAGLALAVGSVRLADWTDRRVSGEAAADPEPEAAP